MSVAENVLALPGHVSPSQISSWHQCGRKYLLERVMKVEQKPQGALIGGSAVHAALEAALTTDADGAVAFKEAFTRAVDEAGGEGAIRWGGRASRAFPNKENTDFWMSEGPRMVARGLLMVEADRALGFNVVSVEAAYNPVIGGRYFQQRADIVLSHPEGTWICRDWKTGASEGDFGPYQLAYYALAVAEVHQVDIGQIVGQIALVRKDGADGIVTYRPSEWVDIAVQFVTDFTAGTEAGVYPMRISALCKSCSVAAACSHGRKFITTEGGDE